MGPPVRSILLVVGIVGIVTGGAFLAVRMRARSRSVAPRAGAAAHVTQAVLDRFDYLSTNGNSSCATSFMDKMKAMDDGARLIGSCCSAMQVDRYNEQVIGLRELKSHLSASAAAMIPDDPYDVEVRLSKRMVAYYDTKLSPQEQTAYDYAMQHSNEKGPCCCQCWRWFVFGGLGKYMIQNYKFTGEQVTQLWNLSDGCGGNG